MPQNEPNVTNDSSGNTGEESSTSKNQCIKYCFTYNNYPQDLTLLNNELSELGIWVYGFEIAPTTGTPHLQGWIRLKKKTRITEFKKINSLKKIHWRLQEKTDRDAIKYCIKDGNFKSNFKSEFFTKPLKIITNLYIWQKQILEIFEKPADDRIVYWIYESRGGTGKSQFCKYLCHHKSAIYIDEGKKSDLVNIIYNTKYIDNDSIIVIDVPRKNKNKVSYKAIEQIKNGMVCNTKYETGMKIFNSPHLIIFSNFYPEKCELSDDRWRIGEIHNEKIEWETDDELTLTF